MTHHVSASSMAPYQHPTVHELPRTPAGFADRLEHELTGASRRLHDAMNAEPEAMADLLAEHYDYDHDDGEMD